MLNKCEPELNDVEQMLLDSASVEEFVNKYSKANPDLSKIDLAMNVLPAWASLRPSLLQCANRNVKNNTCNNEGFAGNGGERTKRHSVSEIFVKSKRDKYL